MPNLPITFGPVTLAVFNIVAFVWFCTEVGAFIEARTTLGKERLFWPLWIALCGIVLLLGLLIDNGWRAS